MAAPSSHSHAAGERPSTSPRARVLLVALVLPFLVATAVGAAALWPDRSGGGLGQELGAPQEQFDAEVVAVERGPCTGTPDAAGVICSRPRAMLLEGPDEGLVVDLQEQSDTTAAIRLERGDTIVLGYFPGAGAGFEYSFADRERGAPLALLTAIFVGAVVGLGWWKGLRALLGLAVSLVVLTTFVLPAILGGANPLAVALVGSAVIATLALYLAHGLNAWTTTALIGTLASLVLVGVLGSVFVDAARFSGVADEESSFLLVTAGQIDFRGLLLGGIVIGALGVLDDVTVTQVSAVWELHAAKPDYGRWHLYRAALRIGRDHIASTVNTLVLAYAGASLPLFLLFTQADQSLVDVVNGETVAVEVVRALVGSIGLVASVPLTTALAVFVAGTSSPPPEAATSSPVPPPAPPPEVEPGPEIEPERVRAIPGDPRRYRSRREERFWEGVDQ